MMSLVDYASSSEDDGDFSDDKQHKSQVPKQEPSSSPNPSNSITSNDIKLPDASILLNSSSISSSSSSSSSSISCESRKRLSNQMAPARSKLPKGKLVHAKNITDTAGALLIPPQLSGKSNIVTEDISKLFVKRKNVHVEP